MSLTEENGAGYVVKVTESATIDMCLSALEAYSVKHIKYQKKPWETFGLVWGHEAIMRDGRALYTIQKISIDTTAERAPGQCTADDKSLDLKFDFINSYYPDIEFLGDFHTHPYLDTPREVRQKKLYEFSDTDIDSIEMHSDFYINYKYRVGLVMTIACVQQERQNEGKLADWISNNSTAEFRFNNYRIWLQAYVTYLQGKEIKVTKENVSLEVPGLLGLHGPYTPFGFYDSKKKHIRRS